MNTAALEEIRDGGLVHLDSTLQTLSDDFSRVDSAIVELASTLQVALEEPAKEISDRPEADLKSVVDRMTRMVKRLQERADQQRYFIDQIRNTIR